MRGKEEEDREKMPPPPVPVKKDTGPVLQASVFSWLRSIPLFNINGFAGKDSCRFQRWSPVVFYESRNQFFFDVIKDH